MTKYYSVDAVYKYMYPATYNFYDEAVGTSGTDISWIESETSTDSTYSAVIIASEDGHNKVIQFDASGDNGTNVTWTSENPITEAPTAGTIEFWYKYIDNGVGIHRLYFRLNAGMATYGYFTANVNKLYFYYGDGIGGHTSDSIVAAADSWHHIRIKFDCTTDTFSVWLNGVLFIDDENFYDDLDGDYLTYIYFRMDGGAGANALKSYVDAIGYSWDTDYTIGDNTGWRHYIGDYSDFESEDWGTTGTSIGMIGSLTTTAEIVPDFTIHKKVLKLEDGGAGSTYINCGGMSTSKTGWIELWVKFDDVTVNNEYLFLRDNAAAASVMRFRVNNSQWDICTALAWRAIAGSPGTPVNDTWYHVFVQWYSNDTLDFWLDNILYEDGTAMNVGMTNGVDRFRAYTNTANSIFWLDGINIWEYNERGDNRLYDYNRTYTAIDETTNIMNVVYSNRYRQERTATLYSQTKYDRDEVWFQVWDGNSKLAFEGEIFKIHQIGIKYGHVLHDLNLSALQERLSHTFSADKIHDPTDSTSMLKTALPNVAQENGRLILVNADSESDTYSPTLINYFLIDFLFDLADLADSCIIIEANGKVHLDSDLTTGESYDVDTTTDKDLMIREPGSTEVVEAINYFEIEGAIDPDTGARFHKEIDNSGDDPIQRWHITNNNLRSQTDVDNFATAIASKMATMNYYHVSFQGIGSHDMGTTLQYKFVNSYISISQAYYYILEEHINFDLNAMKLILSTGIIEESDFSNRYERSYEETNQFASEIYDTDAIIIRPLLYAGGGAAAATIGVELNAVGEYASIYFYTTPEIDDERDIDIYFQFLRVDVNNDTITISKNGTWYEADGSGDSDGFWAAVADTLPASAAGTYYYKKITIDSSDVYSNCMYGVNIAMNEAGRDIDVQNCMIVMKLKRSI